MSLVWFPETRRPLAGWRSEVSGKTSTDESSHGERRAVLAGSVHRAARGHVDLGGDPGEAARGDVPFPETPKVLDDPPEVVPELHPDEGVQHRVQAAVQVGHGLRHRLGHIHGVHRFARLLLEHVDGVVEQRGVVGQVADDEHRHHGQHHPHRLVPLEVPGSQQREDDAAVAEHHDEQRQEEANAHLDAGDGQLHTQGRGVVAEPELADVLGAAGRVRLQLTNE